MLIESGEKSLSALLYDQSKAHNTKHYCMLCLTGFTRADLLETHKKYCNGLKGRPTRIVMPKEEEKVVKFQNYNKQIKAPFVIYADFEALIKNVSCGPRGRKNIEKLHRENGTT